MFFCANFDCSRAIFPSRSAPPISPEVPREVPSRSPPLLARNRRRDACNAPCPDARCHEPAGQLRSARLAAERCAICGRGQGHAARSTRRGGAERNREDKEGKPCDRFPFFCDRFLSFLPFLLLNCAPVPRRFVLAYFACTAAFQG